MTSPPDPEKLIERIRSSVIGDDEAVAGPFGLRRVTYADYTASGRALDFIEDYLREAVLPLYANTHTESSGTGLQTTRFREDARAIIRDSVGGTVAAHAVRGARGSIRHAASRLGGDGHQSVRSLMMSEPMIQVIGIIDRTNRMIVARPIAVMCRVSPGKKSISRILMPL